MKRGLIIALGIMILFVSGCTNQQGEDTKAKEEILVSGFLAEKKTEDKKNYVVFTIPEAIEGQVAALTLEAEKEDYDLFKEGSYYILTYDKDSLMVSNVKINDSLGYLVALGKETDISEEGEKFFLGDKFPVNENTLLDAYTFDMDNDGDEETIGLYTAAEKTPQGEIMWDDGQKWFLIVHEEDKDYTLFDKYIQIGSLQYYAFTAEDGFHIVTMETTTAGLKLVDYVLDQDEEAFIGRIRYEAPGNVNMLHLSRSTF